MNLTFGIFLISQDLPYSEVAQLYLILCGPVDCSSQAPRSMGFPRHEYWSGLLFPSIEVINFVFPLLHIPSLSFQILGIGKL